MTELGLLSILCVAALAAAAGLLVWVRGRPAGAAERVRAARALDAATGEVLSGAHRRAALLAFGLAVAVGAARAATGPRAAVPFAVLAVLTGAAAVLASAHLAARACLAAAPRVVVVLPAGGGGALTLAMRASAAAALGADGLACAGALVVVGIPWITTSGAPPAGLLAHLPELGLGALAASLVVHHVAGSFGAGAAAGTHRGRALLGAADSRDPALVSAGSAAALDVAARSAEHTLAAVAVTLGVVGWGAGPASGLATVGPLVTLPLLARAFGLVATASAAFAVGSREGESVLAPVGRSQLVGAAVAFSGGAAASFWLARDSAPTLVAAASIGALAPPALSWALRALARPHGPLARELAESTTGDGEPAGPGSAGATLATTGALLALVGALAAATGALGGAAAPSQPLLLGLAAGLAAAPLSLATAGAFRTLDTARELDRAVRRGDPAAGTLPGEGLAAGAARTHLALSASAAGLLVGAALVGASPAPTALTPPSALLGTALVVAVLGLALRSATRAGRVARGEITRQVESAPGPREAFVPSYRACLDTLTVASRSWLWPVVALTLGAPVVLFGALLAARQDAARAAPALAAFAIAASLCALVLATAGAANAALASARASLAAPASPRTAAPASIAPLSLVAALGAALVSLHLSTFL
ncbi:MAG: hypothetical protein IT376_17160 [Polyangiaceae bacterium]|nr:hypothetical protein [Polyangiaceae bacterium]